MGTDYILPPIPYLPQGGLVWGPGWCPTWLHVWETAKLSVALDNCDEGESNVLGTLLERFSWRCMLRGLERQRESKQKEKILSDGG